MFKKFEGVNLATEFTHKKATLYRLDAPKLTNKYYIVTSESTRRLLNSPEVVGFECYDCMCNPTKVVLSHFNKKGLIKHANILTILRGGLNYPLEECCYRVGIQVTDMGFLSCERVFHGDTIAGLDIRYKKLSIIDGSSLVIGDIIATGDTLVKCMKHVVKEYRDAGKTLRNIIFFTIGGNRGVTVLEKLTEELREIWPEFEGFHCVYHEGIFSTYNDKGVTGVNLPDVDFYWKDSILAPEYREQTLNDDEAIFEKCTIYDGGARRYQIPEHYEEVVQYWEGILNVATKTDFKNFLDEKFGYVTPLDYESWVAHNHYSKLPHWLNVKLFEQECEFLKRAHTRSLTEIATRRLREFNAALSDYLPKS